MKKLIIGSLVGGILVFLWQASSWTMLNLHGKEYRQAPAQDSVISYLSNQLTEGQYMVPRADDNASSEEMERMNTNMKGKPWAVINYHSSYESNMVNNIIRGFLAALIATFCVCWVLIKNANASFGTIFISCLLIGIAGYLFIPYSEHIWFQDPGAMTNFVDVLVSWGLCGLWLGWWLKR